MNTGGCLRRESEQDSEWELTHRGHRHVHVLFLTVWWSGPSQHLATLPDVGPWLWATNVSQEEPVFFRIYPVLLAIEIGLKHGCMFGFINYSYIVFQRDRAILHFHRCWMKVGASPKMASSGPAARDSYLCLCVCVFVWPLTIIVSRLVLVCVLTSRTDYVFLLSLGYTTHWNFHRGQLLILSWTICSGEASCHVESRLLQRYTWLGTKASGQQPIRNYY